MISRWLHKWFGIHDWEHYQFINGKYNRRKCQYCGKGEVLVTYSGVGGIFCEWIDDK